MVKVKDLKLDLQIWSNELKFLNDELKIFKKHLAEIAIKNTNKDILSQVEHYQNVFIRQAEVIDELNHLMVVENDKLMEEVKKNPEHYFQVRFDDHTELRDKMETHRKIYKEMRDEFYKFLGTWL